MNNQFLGGGFQRQSRSMRPVRVNRKCRTSNKNLILWIGLALLIFFALPYGVIALGLLYYINKLDIRMYYRKIIIPLVIALAIATLMGYLNSLYLSVIFVIGIVLIFCRRISIHMK